MLKRTPHRWLGHARLRLSAVLLPLVLLCLSAWPVRVRCQQDVHAPLIARGERKPAPAFHLTGEDGTPKQLRSYRGRVVLLNFWATTCGGCVLEIPSFIDLQKTYSAQGFTAVGISAEIPYEGVKTPEEAWRRVRPFITSHGINYPILMGTPATIDSFGFKAYPATYLLDRSGRIAATYLGVVSKQDVEANLQVLLAERQ